MLRQLSAHLHGRQAYAVYDSFKNRQIKYLIYPYPQHSDGDFFVLTALTMQCKRYIIKDIKQIVQKLRIES